MLRYVFCQHRPDVVLDPVPHLEGGLVGKLSPRPYEHDDLSPGGKLGIRFYVDLDPGGHGTTDDLPETVADGSAEPSQFRDGIHQLGQLG